MVAPVPLDINTVTGQYKGAIKRMDTQKQQEILKWLNTQTLYFRWENSFNPESLIKYNRGDIIFTNFGRNIGSEFNGLHYAAVLDDNDKSSETLMIVPLSSLDENESEDDLHEMDAFLGTIPAINNKKVFARVAQMRSLSKIRIYNPKKAEQTKYRLTSPQLDIIDEKIRRYFTSIPKKED
ncbi:hypothetical protein A9C19_20685 (plasmid) [Bacillus weihaiensis]|uniref:Type II toxin-antitoxin system PemK/MazF family toxin n=1 Tax=Bacillus weihaiensis TaxID=1547283 RepID=A0A1L3MY00_9BACI|nr:hypothetical protein A9C19_20685 [Bacillus weihaiensis]